MIGKMNHRNGVLEDLEAEAKTEKLEKLLITRVIDRFTLLAHLEKEISVSSQVNTYLHRNYNIAVLTRILNHTVIMK